MSESIVLDDLKVHSWEIEPEWFSDIIVRYIFIHNEKEYASLINKPKFEEINDYLATQGLLDKAVVCGHFRSTPNQTIPFWELKWLCRLFDDLEVKQDCDDMRFMFALNSSALKSLSKSYSKELRRCKKCKKKR